MDNLRYLIEALRGGATTTLKNGKVVSQVYPTSKDKKASGPSGKILNAAERNALKET